MGLRYLVGAGLLAACAAANGQQWQCYDPQPGHPTGAERKAFVDDISRHALAAEVRHGVPAPAIVAMAIQESGYGFTRTALNANNLFGFKWLSAAGAGNRASWELVCQPASDKNNRYIRFQDRADAIDFVAGRLAASQYYRHDTEAFKAAMARGADRTAAISAWIDGIAEPYNADPPAYSRTVKRLLNNPPAPSDSLSSTDNLYRLVPASPAAATGAAAPVGSAGDAAMLAKVGALFQKGIDAGGRYMEKGCKDVAESDSGLSAIVAPYRGLPAKGVRIVDCSYPFEDKSARVIMANVDAPQLARWTLSACKTNQVGNLDRCLAVTSHSIWCGSNAQFAISGAVREPAEICDKSAAGKALMTFRDGVTVETVGAPYCAKTPFSAAEEQASITGKVSKVKQFGRVAMATREMYGKAGGKVDVSATKPNASGKNPWLDVVRDDYIEAIGQNAYPLLAAWVRSTNTQFGRYGKLDLHHFNCCVYFDPTSKKCRP